MQQHQCMTSSVAHVINHLLTPPPTYSVICRPPPGVPTQPFLELDSGRVFGRICEQGRLIGFVGVV
jgi:hypothetical protein